MVEEAQHFTNSARTTKQSIELQPFRGSRDSHASFQVEFRGDLAAAISAPITEVAILHFGRSGPPQDYLTRFEGEALPSIVANHTRGFVGMAFGKTCEDIRAGRHIEPIPSQFATHTGSSLDEEGQAVVVVGGYESIKAHQLIRADKEQFETVAPLLVRNAGFINKFYAKFVRCDRAAVTQSSELQES